MTGSTLMTTIMVRIYDRYIMMTTIMVMIYDGYF